MRSISKVVLAGAVAGACSYAAAGTLVAVTTPYSLESAQTAGVTTVVYSGQTANASGVAGTPARLLIAASDVSTGQRLTISGSGFGSADQHAASFTCSAGAVSGSLTFSISTGASNSSTIVYSVTQALGAGGAAAVTTGASCAIPSIAFAASSLNTAQNIDISGVITVNNTGATIDSFTATRIASVGNEWAASVAAADRFNAEIDVASGRMTFSTATATDIALGSASGYADKMVMTLTRTASTTIGGAYAGTFSVTLAANPDFAFLTDGAASGVCTFTSGNGQGTAFAGASTAAGTVSVSPTSAGCSTLTAQFAAPFADTYTIGLGRIARDVTASSTAAAFAPTTYTAGYSFRNVVGSATLTATNSSSTLAAGSWTQNGTTALLQYVPISATIPLQIIVANTSSVNGALSFTAYSNGASCTGTLGSVNANSTVTVGSLLRSALLGQAAATSNCPATFTNQEGRAAVSLLSTTPSANTRVHSGFTVTGSTDSRQIIINSTN